VSVIRFAASTSVPVRRVRRSGFVFDDEANTGSTCRCRPQRVALAKARHLSAVIPRRYADVSFDDLRSPRSTPR